jgi:hypothetical protein
MIMYTRMQRWTSKYTQTRFTKQTNKQPTCFPVNPWQMTRVFLSTQTLAVDDMDRVAVE